VVRGCPSPLSRPSRKSLTFARLPAILRPMRFALRPVSVLRSALCTRRDLFLEILALRHQLGVLSRADRRFRPSDRLFWMCLRRVWPRWREALVLVQPATVDRWHRCGFHGWWSARSRRRPGRPRIDSAVRDLIRRMNTENRLWGAPRIHGELLKLGIAVSERTVSRYLPDRTTGRSQTWRTFLTNHFGALLGNSAVASSERPGDVDVVDTGLLARRLTSMCGTAERLQPHSDCQCRSFGSTRVSWLTDCVGPTLTAEHGQAGSGRDPPRPFCRFDWPNAYARGLLHPAVRFIRGAQTVSGDSFARRTGSLANCGLSVRGRLHY
jgi:hypothetical protein